MFSTAPSCSVEITGPSAGTRTFWESNRKSSISFFYLPRKPDIAMSRIPVFRFQSIKSGNEVTSYLEGHPGRCPALSWPESA